VSEDASTPEAMAYYKAEFSKLINDYGGWSDFRGLGGLEW